MKLSWKQKNIERLSSDLFLDAADEKSVSLIPVVL